MLLDDVDADWYRYSEWLIYWKMSFNLLIKFFRFKLLNCASESQWNKFQKKRSTWPNYIEIAYIENNTLRLFWTYCWKLAGLDLCNRSSSLTSISWYWCSKPLYILEIFDRKCVSKIFSKGFKRIKSFDRICETIRFLIILIESLLKKCYIGIREIREELYISCV